MLESIFEWFLVHTIEGQNFGWNVKTFAAAGTVGFTCWQLWALVHQYRTLRTGESVSIGWNAYFSADFLAFFIYAIYSTGLAMGFNALLGLGHLLVLIGLLRVKRPRVFEWPLLPLVVIFPVLMLFAGPEKINVGFAVLSERQILFLSFSVGTVAAFMLQPLEMFLTKKRGDVSFPVLLSYSLSTVFWIIYAFQIAQDFVLKFLTLGAGFALALSLFFWVIYRPRPEEAPAE